MKKTRKQPKSKPRIRLTQFQVSLLGLQAILTLWLSITLLVNQVMPNFLTIVVIAIMMSLNLITLYQFWMSWERRIKLRRRYLALSLVSIVLAVGALVMVAQSERLINKIRAAHDNYVHISLVAPQGPITLGEVRHIKYTRLSDEPYLDAVLEQLKIESNSVADYQALTQALFNQQATAILVNEAYRDLIADIEPDFAKKTKVLRTFKFNKEQFERLSKPVALPSYKQEPFNLYISGIDTYGNVATVSRSDVNIVANINPITRRIVLVNVPRDAYIKIPGGGQNQFDKLTHAGLYGASASMGALENLLSVPIKYYVRINFTSLMRVIEYLNDVTVDNPIGFQAVTGDHFAQGQIKLNSKQALAYARERKHLSGGDFDRGANQQRLIQAIVQRVSQQKDPTRLYQALDRLSDAIQTNIPKELIKQLLSSHITKTGDWHFEAVNVTGRGQTGGLKSFAMPNAQLYMMVPNPQSVAEAQAKIRANSQ